MAWAMDSVEMVAVIPAEVGLIAEVTMAMVLEGLNLPVDIALMLGATMIHVVMFIIVETVIQTLLAQLRHAHLLIVQVVFVVAAVDEEQPVECIYICFVTPFAETNDELPI